MKLDFTQLTNRLKYPVSIRAKLSTIHAEMIDYAIANFENTPRFKKKFIAVFNTVSYYQIEGDTNALAEWSASSPFDNIEPLDPMTCKNRLGWLYAEYKDIHWDIDIPDEVPSKPVPVESSSFVPSKVKPDTSSSVKSRGIVSPTPKDHLYLRPPLTPRFDVSKPWLQRTVGQIPYTIYKSLPLIPSNQSQISVTTDINSMTTADFMRLYPNCLIRTRAKIMYEPQGSLTLDPDVGIILPIIGFSPKQIKDNIIRYPHWFKLVREVDGKFVSFYSQIEINGELKDTLEIWDSLPDSKKIPRNSEYIKEYVVRRYLLERDIKHIEHRYPIYGTLDPFLTLFAPTEFYIKSGYKDTLGNARQCVESRIKYKQSRNPVLRAIKSEVHDA